jgi:hypothetical protein
MNYEKVYDSIDRYTFAKERAENSSGRSKIEWEQSASWWWHLFFSELCYMLLEVDECGKYEKVGDNQN